MKTAISIPDKLFIAADNYAKDLGVSRSYLYASAIAKFLEQQSTDHITQQLLKEIVVNISQISTYIQPNALTSQLTYPATRRRVLVEIQVGCRQ